MRTEGIESASRARTFSRTKGGTSIFGAILVAGLMLATLGVGAVSWVASHAPAATSLSAMSGPSGMAGAPNVQFGPITHTYSYNWAGYADSSSNGAVLEVSANWFIPTTTCGEPNANGAALNDMWVGIDGFANGNVSQLGTAGWCPSHGATPTYYLWWEFYPYNSAQFVYTASAGDAIQAYVLYNPSWCIYGHCGLYTLYLDDISSGQTITVTGNGYYCSGSGCEGGPAASAECISEETNYQLAKYTGAQFYSCEATIGGYHRGIGGFPAATTSTYAITQYGPVSGLKAQTVTPLLSAVYAHDTFDVNWHHFE